MGLFGEMEFERKERRVVRFCMCETERDANGERKSEDKQMCTISRGK